MFFAPTLLALSAPHLGNHIKILCLSTGDQDGLGHLRKKELVKSAEMLGLRRGEDVFVIDDPRFRDGVGVVWEKGEVARVLGEAFGSAGKGKEREGREKGPEATIDVLLTFDRGGVSGHTNHVSLYHGARAWLEGLMKGREGWRCPVDMYTLTSTNIVRKYMSALDAPVSMLWGVLEGVFKGERKDGGRSSQGREGATQAPPEKLLFVSDIAQYRTAQKAMTHGHKSQMRWFRWGWIGVGRYVVVNDLKRELIR